MDEIMRSEILEKARSNVVSKENLPTDVEAKRPITGRSVFEVRLVGEGVSFETGFLVEDGQVLRLPAVFPNRAYAHEQINDIIVMLHRHFDELEAKYQSVLKSSLGVAFLKVPV